jgi:hypothetical protein
MHACVGALILRSQHWRSQLHNCLGSCSPASSAMRPVLSWPMRPRQQHKQQHPYFNSIAASGCRQNRAMKHDGSHKTR